MLWQVTAAVRGNLREQMRQETIAAEIAVTAVTKSKIKAIRNGMSRDIRKAGFNRRGSGAALHETVRFRMFPQRGRSINAAGIVVSKALYKRRSGTVDLLQVFDQSRVVRAGGGRFLAIPTDAAPLSRSGRRRASPSEARIATVIIKTDNPRVLAVIRKGDRGDPPTVLWFLVPNVRLTKRFDLQKVFVRLSSNYHDLIVKRWEREAKKRGLAPIR